MRYWQVLHSIFFLLAISSSADAQRINVGSYGLKPMPSGSSPENPSLVDFDQKLAAKVPLDLTFYDHNSSPRTLRELVNDKPTILTLAYSRCPRLCNEVLTKLLDSIKDVRRNDASMVAGQQFNVIVVSIDPKDSPEGHIRPRRGLFLKEYDGRTEDTPGIWFMTASHGQGTDLLEADRSIHKLSDAVGFRYTLHARGEDYIYETESGKWISQDDRLLTAYPREYEFQHAPGIVFLAPDGTITRYLLGLDYRPATVRQAIVEASGGKVGSLADKVVFYCLAYDDATGHYRPTMKVLAGIAAIFVVIVGFITYRTVRSGLRENSKAITVKQSPGQQVLNQEIS